MPSLKPSSYDRLKQTYLKQIKNTSVGRSQLGTLTSLGIQALINSYTTTLSYSTLKKVYDLLNNCYRYAVATRNIGYNPVDGVQLPKQENMSIQTKEIAILPDVDVELLEAAQSMMLSRLVDTFFSRTSWTMLLYAENHSISVA